MRGFTRILKLSLLAVFVVEILGIFYLYLRGHVQTWPSINVLGFFSINFYPVCLLAGVGLAVFIARKIASKDLWISIDKLELLVYLLIPGVIGARLYHVITDYNLYTENLVSVLFIWQGGLGIIGGMIGGLLGLYIYCKRDRVSFSQVLGVLAVVFPIAQSVGRLGNFFNQEIFGYPTNLPWGMFVRLENRPADYATFEFFHPLFLYEAIANILISLLLYHFYKRGLHGYRLAVYYLALYGLVRFALDLLRVEGVTGVGGLSYTQWLILILYWAAFLFGIGYQLWYKRTRGKWFTSHKD